MTTMQRFILDRGTLAGAVTMAGLTGGGESLLPEAAKPNQRKLSSAGALSGDSLDPGFASALMAAAAPPRVLVVGASGAGRPAWVESRFIPANDAVISWAEREGEFDVAVLGARTAAVLLIDQLLRLTDLPTGEPNATHELSVPGYVALLAAADLMQASTLRARLERTVQEAPPVLDPEALSTLVVEGIRKPDTRWAVSAGALTSPAPFPTDAAAIDAGLEELKRLGLVAGRPKELRVSSTGIDLVDALGRIINLGSLELFFPLQGDATGARIALFRSLAAIWAAVWGYRDGVPRVTLLELDHRAALGLIEDLLDELAVPEPSAPPAPRSEPIPAPEEPARASTPASGANQFCGKCGTPYKDDTVTFCTGCGAPRA